jgi:trehalose transport system substrate-binding protein
MSLGEEEWSVLRGKVFPLFEKANKVKINSYQIESGRLATKLLALKQGGRSPIDVFAQDNMSLSMLARESLVSDLSGFRGMIPDSVMDNLVEACEFDGKLLFMPFRPNVQIVYFNKEAFAKYGLEPPRTWDELKNAGEVFKKNEGKGRLLFKGYGGGPTATQVYELVLQAGGDPLEFDDEGCVKAFEFLKSLRPYLSQETKRAKWDTVNGILAKKEAYIAQNWPFGVMTLIEKYKLDFIDTYSGWAGPEGEYHVIGGDVFGIPVNSKKKDMAIKFIMFMQSAEAQRILVSELGWPPIREDAYAQVEDWQKPHFESVKNALKKGVFRKNVSWWPDYEKYVSEAFRQIVFNGADIKKTLNKYKIIMNRRRGR